jgi:hypothetical protein
MGLLDDAIREHLDLKRRRGADPAEIERAERDALGPVRRGPEADEVELDHMPAADDDLVYDDEAEQDWAEEGAPEPGAVAPAEPPEFEPALDDEDERWDSEDPFDHEEPEGAAAAAEPGLAEPPRPAPASSEPKKAAHDRAPAPPEPDNSAGGETAEFNVEVEEELRVEGGEDVLEETPEFLQDTPDHDRLWFEQRPPKDFDFDG